jgi:hypothetical protein
MRQQLLIVTAVCACTRTSNPDIHFEKVQLEVPAAFNRASRTDLLRELHRQLAIISSAKPDQLVMGTHGLWIQPLIGASRADVETALGRGVVCDRAGPVGSSCKAAGDASYSMVHVPEHGMGYVGGSGAALVLHYAGTDQVRDAQWLHYQ